MEQFRAFMEMGGYGAFVWPAFGLTAVIMIGLLATTVRRLRATERALARLQAAGLAPRSGAVS
ncbi:MAG: heme exporter protein CcmD [Kiloniellaceae bacterium]